VLSWGLGWHGFSWYGSQVHDLRCVTGLATLCFPNFHSTDFNPCPVPYTPLLPLLLHRSTWPPAVRRCWRAALCRMQGRVPVLLWVGRTPPPAPLPG
jgi:hypothetical protein